MEFSEIISIVLIYFVIPVLVVFGVMYLIRRKRDKQAGRKPSHKIKSIKEEELEGK
ncbi:hypothetical protein LVD17_18475 [Fulvivirga ulvae]|uniref:hypothetical protein n=1 Tax=Fulvivirga ulvae TaxID=2904245 RepID=UPI001F357D84|nr:hypothetical protein [Fulvivirga ulvae]UII30282.1 hypothetical protein LVD17_18475 [Fulvivirga ulvae]